MGKIAETIKKCTNNIQKYKFKGISSGKFMENPDTEEVKDRLDFIFANHSNK
jgi:hypothetical protein